MVTTAPDSLLRPALVAAVAVAKAGEAEEPVVPAPVGLRPLLNFAKLPARALPAARRALDGDDDFRARVADSVSEEGVGRAGWLFLTRPPGWDDEISALARALSEMRGAPGDAKGEHEALKRAARAEATAQRAEADAAHARAEAEKATVALTRERQTRRRLGAQRDELEARVAAMADERDVALRRAAESAAAAKTLRAEVSRLTKASAAGSGNEASAAGSGNEASAAGLAAGEALRAASEAASTFSRSLAAAAAILGEEAVEQVRASEPGSVVATVVPRRQGATAELPGQGATARPVARSGGAKAVTRFREPTPLPPAVFEDSREAAEHLVRLRAVVVLVDGYNVSQSAWPAVSITDQRRRLVDALSGLVARTGADVRVVFDGSDLAVPMTIPTAPQAVKVSFSPPGTEADDVIIASLSAVAVGRPLVVASSDRRVQEGARRGGANVITSQQLLALVR